MNSQTLSLRSIADMAAPRVLRRVIEAVERVPLSLVQVMGRVALASLFWKSAQSKLASWEITQQLFAYEYQVPLLSPELAAVLGTAAELGGAVLLFFGLMTRFGALALLGVTATIQLFVFPGNWGEHLLWASLLILLIARGGGVFSCDYLLTRLLTAGR